MEPIVSTRRSATAVKARLATSLIAYDKYIARLVMISFFLPNRPQIIVLITLCLFWLIRDTLTDTIKRSRPYRWAWLLGGIYLLYLIALPFTEAAYQRDVRFDLEQKASLLLMPFILLFLQPRTRRILAGELIYFALACFVACLITNLMYLRQYGWQWHTDDPVAHVWYRRFFEAITGIHCTYLGIYICFAIAILLMPLNGRPLFRGWKLGAALFPFFIFMLALLPKAPMIALILMLLYYAGVNWRQREAWTPVIASLLIAVVFATLFIPFTAQRVGEFSGFFNPTYQQNPLGNSVDMRQIIIAIDMAMLKQHWLMGVGPGALDAFLNEQYALYSQKIHQQLETFDTHNEYTNLWLCFGLPGILLFVGTLLFQAIKAFQWGNHLYILFLIAFTVTCFTENVLSMQHGVTFYAFFSSLFFLRGMERQGKENTRSARRPELQYSVSSVED